jgi:hypothetical protein
MEDKTDNRIENENITFEVYDSSISDEFECELDDLISTNFSIPHSYLETVDYFKKYTVKKLLLICDYYSLTKLYHMNKKTKDQIINIIILFEQDPDNQDIVNKRRNMWYFISELTKDKFMKNYVLW